MTEIVTTITILVTDMKIEEAARTSTNDKVAHTTRTRSHCLLRSLTATSHLPTFQPLNGTKTLRQKVFKLTG